MIWKTVICLPRGHDERHCWREGIIFDEIAAGILYVLNFSTMKNINHSALLKKLSHFLSHYKWIAGIHICLDTLIKIIYGIALDKYTLSVVMISKNKVAWSYQLPLAFHIFICPENEDIKTWVPSLSPHISILWDFLEDFLSTKLSPSSVNLWLSLKM